MSHPNPHLSVVIPFYNEEESIEPVLAELVQVLDELPRDHEIIAVDDGSTDRTPEILRSLKSRIPGLRVLRMARNAGQTAAMQAGFDATRGEIVVTLDGDGQNDPSAIGTVLKRMDDGFDLVCGWRMRRQDHLVSRKIPSWIANRLIGRLTGVRIHDNGCSLKAYRGDMLRRMRLYSDQHRFIPALASVHGARIAEVRVPHRARVAGESKYGLSRTWKVLVDVVGILMLRRGLFRPLITFGSPGVVCVLAALMLVALRILPAWSGEQPLVVLGGIATLLLFLAGHFFVLAFAAVLVRDVDAPEPRG